MALSDAVVRKIRRNIKDRSVERALLKAAQNGRITPKEMGRVIKAALDKGKITNNEKRDLKWILRNADDLMDVRPKARRALQRFWDQIKGLEDEKLMRKVTGDDLDAYARVIQTWSNKVRFHHPGYPIKYIPQDYDKIAKLVRDESIDVYEFFWVGDDSELTSFGSYNSHKDVLRVRLDNRSAMRVNSTLVHEATHAIQDRRNRTMHRWHLEAGAHIAQAVVLLAKGGELYNSRLRAARAAARWVLDGNDTLKQADYDAVREEVSKVGSYKDPYSHGTYDRDFGSEWYAFFEGLYFELMSAD